MNELFASTTKYLFDKNIFQIAMLSLCGFGILSKLLINLVYKRLLKASDNMTTSKNKLTQMMKKKFETYYNLKIGVHNVDIFVDKYIFRHKFCGILLSTWENIGGQVLMLCLLIGSISSILGLIYECGKTQILSTFSVGILTSGLLIFLEGMINLSGKKELIILNMKDYFENILKVRLEQEAEKPELIEQYKKEYLNQESEEDTIGSEAYIAATKETSKSDKPISKRAKKRAEKKQEKEELRNAKQNKKAEAIEAREKKKEEKIFAKERKKREAEQKRMEMREASERMKREAKLALEKKREAERAEIERIKQELKAQEERQKEEKRRQEEIKKVLQLEKQIAKENKKKPTEHKTIAQERKESLLREIKGRRALEENEVEAKLEHVETVEAQEKVENQIAATKVEEILKADNTSTEQKNEIVNVNDQIDIPQVQIQANNEKKESKPVDEVHKKEVGKHVPVEFIEGERISLKESKTSSESGTMKQEQVAKPVKKAANKKSKQLDSADDKLIEDILKEFLA